MKAENRLLIELLGLLERYQAEDWDIAIKRLQDERFRSRFMSVLGLLSEIAKEQPSKTKILRLPKEYRGKQEKTRPTRKSESMASLEKLSNTELRQLLSVYKVQYSEKDNRQRLLKKIARSKYFEATKPIPKSSGDYENWVNIIMRKK